MEAYFQRSCMDLEHIPQRTTNQMYRQKRVLEAGNHICTASATDESQFLLGFFGALSHMDGG